MQWARDGEFASVSTIFCHTGWYSLWHDRTTEEWHIRRRLVQFWRRQEGTTIHTQFRVISQSEWSASQSSIVISCVFWEEKKSCYITSVDIIYLLEALVGIHFTVEEKNRIRRNLEGFRPITIDKSKPDTENFFGQIMNLPNPRPRNIEKNVKVYAWDCLEAALQKIIGKYVSVNQSFSHVSRAHHLYFNRECSLEAFLLPRPARWSR